MSSHGRRLFRIVLGGLAGLAGLFALVVLFNQGLSLVGCTAAMPMGWTVPIVSLLVIGAAAWVLLSQPEKDTGPSAEFRSIDCPTCGRTVLAAWRLCPYCGSDAQSSEPTDAPVEPATSL